MRSLPLILLLVLAAGCRPAAQAPLLFPLDATSLPAQDFIAEAVARERPMNEFIEVFGMPFAQERDGELVFLYDCQDASVCLYGDREKFDKGVVDVVEEEVY